MIIERFNVDGVSFGNVKKNPLKASTVLRDFWLFGVIKP